MATANSKLLIDFGFDARASSNIDGNLRVEGDFFVNGNITSALNVTGDLNPTVSGSRLGSAPLRWDLLANSGNFTNTVTITGATSLQDTLTVSKTISGGNTTITGFANVTTSVNSAIFTVGTDLIANTSGIYHTGIVNAASFTTSGLLANATAIVPTSNTILLGNSTGRFVISANSVDTVSVQSSTINSTSNGLFANSTTVSLGNSTVNIAITTAGITSSGGTGVNPASNTLGATLGTSTQRWNLNAGTINTSGLITGGAGATITGQVNATTGFGSGTVNATSNGLFANATVVTVGNSSVNVAITPAGVTSSGGTGVNPASNTLGTALGTSTQRWIINANTGNFSGELTAASTSNLVGNVTMGGTLQTISGNTNFDSGVLFVDAASNKVGINNTAPTVALEVTGAANVSTNINAASHSVGTNFIANTSGVYHTAGVNAASFTSGNTTATTLTANSSGVFPVSNTNGNSLGSSTQRWIINANTANFSGNVTIGTSGGIVANGLIGTAGQVLASNGSSVFWSTQVGPQGAVGAQGAQGFQGVQGTNGTNGAQGTIGAQGAQGRQGFDGVQGAVGAQGAQGAQGTIGAQGAQGTIGAQGAQGAAGGFSTNSDAQVNSLGVNTAASGSAGEIRATGEITAGYSDDRLKNKLGPILNALDKVKHLSGFYYEPNDLAISLGYQLKREVGISAQEVNAVQPETVTDAPIDNKYLTVRYERLIPLLIEAIKELNNEVDDLRNQINELKNGNKG